MESIRYDFSSFHNAFANIILADGIPEANDSHMLKEELNKFFKDSKCKEVYMTTNTDKIFFGMRVMPIINADDIYEYLTDNRHARIDHYMVEIDSRLFDPIMALNEREMTAILLYEVGRLVNDSAPMKNAKDFMNSYLADNRESLSMTDSIHYKEILSYGLKDFLSKDRSLFYTTDQDEVLANEFIRGYGYIEYLDSGFSKLLKSNPKIYVDSDVSKFTIFAWTMRLYKNIAHRRIGALRTITKAKQFTGSRIDKMELENIARRINRIDDEALITESVKSAVKAKIAKARRNIIRSVDDDYYELNMRIRNVQDEEDALYLMRQINNHIGMLEDYVNTADLDTREQEKWFASIEKFKRLRENLSKTATYKSKTYGIFVAYPEIKENNY